MRRIPAMIDMHNTPEEAKEEAGLPTPYKPAYPWGLCISLDQISLDKLDLDEDVRVGDMIHVQAMCKVTSVSQREDDDGKPDCRIELQITHIAVEDEDEEGAEADEGTSAKERMGRLYKE